MSANPKKAVRAALPLDLNACGETIRPMTLAMWAALERIESPMLPGRTPKDTLDLIPSLYLLTHDPREVFRGNVVDLSMQWADTVPVATMDAIRRACYRQMNAAFDVMPEDEPKKARGAATTASSPRSCTGRPKPTTGASKTSSGASRSRRSACSDGRGSSSPTGR